MYADGRVCKQIKAEGRSEVRLPLAVPSSYLRRFYIDVVPIVSPLEEHSRILELLIRAASRCPVLRISVFNSVNPSLIGNQTQKGCGSYAEIIVKHHKHPA